MTEDKFKDGRERLSQLIGKAASHVWSANSSAPLRVADVDEIKFLTELMKAELPSDFLEIVREGVAQDQSSQINFGQRLERSQKLHEKYGNIKTQEESVSDPSELYPRFHLDADERERVLKLSSDIRKIVLSSTAFDEPHKRRLLNRIAAIEKEVLQPTGRLDTVLAGISDVGDTLKKFGGDLKPLTDRYKEIVRITRGRSNQYDQLPSPEEFEALPAPDQTDGE